MPGINKKAADQYTSFTEQKKELEARKSELDNGRQAIMKLIQHLDAKKEEAIQRTYKAIAYHFRQVFSEIVPGR
jgi:structural maintenance of chromosome 3 (chondroitin sulfate proteoglycan 6)